jgi:DNA polymerase-3 subunit alpha
MEIRVEPPDVQVSGAQFTPVVTPEGEAIRFGLAAVKNVGGNAIESIMKARAEVGGRFKSLWEFCEKVDLRVMNKRVIESLIKAGALDALGSRAALMKSVDKAMERAQKAQKDAAAGQHGLFGLFNESPAPGRDADDLPKVADWEEGERLANEKEVLGFFVSGHPLDKYAEKLRNLSGVISTAEALERKPPERVWGKKDDPADELQVVGILHGTASPRKSKKDGKLYAMGHLEDATGKIEVICFAREYDRLAEQLKIEAPVLIRGTLMGDEDSAPKISISGIQPLDAVQVKLPSGVRIRINLDRATEELFAGLKRAADEAPGPGKVMLHLEKKGEYAVILEPEGMNVAADRGWVERMEELVGKGTVQAVG